MLPTLHRPIAAVAHYLTSRSSSSNTTKPSSAATSLLPTNFPAAPSSSSSWEYAKLGKKGHQFHPRLSRRARWFWIGTLGFLILCSVVYVWAFWDVQREQGAQRRKQSKGASIDESMIPSSRFRNDRVKSPEGDGTAPSERHHQPSSSSSSSSLPTPTPPPPRFPPPVPITFVSAASTNHACELQNLAKSIYFSSADLPSHLRPRFIAYDLGNNGSDLDHLRALKSRNMIHELHRFEYERYPPHVSMTNRDSKGQLTRGHYAWKPLIISEVVKRTRTGIVVWVDAGNLISDVSFSINLLRYLRPNDSASFTTRSSSSSKSTTSPSSSSSSSSSGVVPAPPGFWSPLSPGTMSTWTHPGLFRYHNADASRFADLPNCNGALLAFDVEEDLVWENLIAPWRDCALVEDCIAPPGSSRDNHRQDQSALTYLASANGFRCGGGLRNENMLSGLDMHQDRLCGPPMAGWKV